MSAAKTMRKPHRGKRQKSIQAQERFCGYLFTVPVVIINSIFIYLPLLYSLIISFMDFNLFKGFWGSKFIGLKNYINMFKDPVFWISFKNNIIYTVVTVPVLIIVSLILAEIINRAVYARGLARAMFFLPYIGSASAMSLVWMMMYNPQNGIINDVLRKIGIENPPLWLASDKTALIALMIMAIWTQLGYNIVLFIGGLQGIDQSLYEAAKVDGASAVRQFFSISVPLVSPTTFFLVVTDVIASFQVFANVQIMTQGGPNNSTSVLTYFMYKVGFAQNQMGLASAILWFLMLIVFIITIIQMRGQKKWVHY